MSGQYDACEPIEFDTRLTLVTNPGDPVQGRPQLRRPSVLIAYGHADRAVLETCGLPGAFVDLTAGCRPSGHAWAPPST